jgi:DNA-binding response OmpR family regulator
VKGTVLLVEDHPELAATVGDFLEAKGCTVDFAADGPLAVTASFDAIILDVMLSGLDGIKVCQRLCKDADLTTPVLETLAGRGYRIRPGASGDGAAAT